MFQRTLCRGCRVAWTTTGTHLDRRENVVWKFGGQILELETCSTIPRKSLDNNDRMLYTLIHKKRGSTFVIITLEHLDGL